MNMDTTDATALSSSVTMFATDEDNLDEAPYDITAVPEQRLFLPARIGDHEIAVLIDSGSEDSFIDSQLAGHLGLATDMYRTDPITVRFPDGSTSSTRLLVNATIRIRNFKFQHQCFALPLHGYDIILGMPWLRQLNPDIDWSTQLVRIERQHTRFVLRGIGGPHVSRAATCETKRKSDYVEVFMPLGSTDSTVPRNGSTDGSTDATVSPTAPTDVSPDVITACRDEGWNAQLRALLSEFPDLFV